MNQENINDFSIVEEIWHAITHGLGLALSIAGLAILIGFASINGSPMAIISSAIYGTTLIMMYGSSTLYHAITNKPIKGLFQKFDHSSIYFLIAGSYTPITLVSLEGIWGYTLATAVWGTATFGIYMKFAYPNSFEKLSLVLYLLMGWSIVIAISPLRDSLETGGFYLLITGGLSYTLGIYYYINDHKPFYHAVWHLFVLGGSVFHFFLILLYII